jgi:threonyl-tRNA synthetase
MLVAGEQELANASVSLRVRNGSRKDNMPLAEFIDMVQERIKTRSAEL